MKYKLTDQDGNKIASGDQLGFKIEVNLEHKEMRVTSGVISTTCDITAQDRFTLEFN